MWWELLVASAVQIHMSRTYVSLQIHMSVAAPKQTLPSVGGLPGGAGGAVPLLAEPGTS